MSESSTLAPAPTRLRQIALVARDINRARELLVRNSLSTCISSTDPDVQTHVIGTSVLYEDPAVGQWGLRNFLSMSRSCWPFASANILRSSTRW